MSPKNEAPRRSARLAKRDSVSTDAGSPAIDGSYNSMKVAELKELLRQHGLGVSGNKTELISRLKDANVNVNAQHSRLPNETQDTNQSDEKPHNKRRKLNRLVTPDTIESTTESKNKSKASVSIISQSVICLPRTREMKVKSSSNNIDLTVIGVDEAGRGPLAGPVVAAAAIVPTNIPGVIDSKKITKEEEREKLYEAIIASPGVRYAVAVISAQRIDEINILQATLEGMRMATLAVLEMDKSGDGSGEQNNVASAERTESSYVVTGSTKDNGATRSNQLTTENYYALIDGNKVPKEMPCAAESMVQGDGREFSIAAASILAKVTRDRLMHEYDLKYPEYELSRHKGYPTAAHMAVVKRIGASPIHRRTFAPLKHMKFDEDGKILN